MKEVYTNHKRLPLVDFHHDFNLIEDDGLKILNRSNAKTWTEGVRGTEAARLVDDGNKLVALFSNGKGITLEYDQAEELFILMSQCEWDGIEIKESKTTMKWPSSL